MSNVRMLKNGFFLYRLVYVKICFISNNFFWKGHGDQLFNRSFLEFFSLLLVYKSIPFFKKKISSKKPFSKKKKFSTKKFNSKLKKKFF